MLAVAYKNHTIEKLNFLPTKHNNKCVSNIQNTVTHSFTPEETCYKNKMTNPKTPFLCQVNHELYRLLWTIFCSCNHISGDIFVEVLENLTKSRFFWQVS